MKLVFIFRYGLCVYCFSSFDVVSDNVLQEKKINLSYGCQKNPTIAIKNYISVELNKYIWAFLITEWYGFFLLIKFEM